MASGPYPDPRRGTWSIQWNDGSKWRRVVVVKKRPGWKTGDAMPAKAPAAAYEELARFIERERAAKTTRKVRLDRDDTVADFLARYRQAFSLRNRASSVPVLDNCIEKFLSWCEVCHVGRLLDVTPAICQEYLNSRASGGIAHSTLVREVGLLGAAWSQAVKMEQVERNPWRHVTNPAKRASKARGSWTPDEFSKLLFASSPWLLDLLMLGVNTGIRISALLALEWSDVEWSEEEGYGFVRVRPEWDKAKKGYRVPLTRAAHELLARRFGSRADGVNAILVGHAGKPLANTSHTAKAIARACKRAGLSKPSSPNHHMRRSFGRWAVLGQLTGRPIPIYVVSRWMGHASVAMTQRYLDIRDEESAKWMEEAS